MSVSISLVWPSSSMIAAGRPPGSRRVAHSARVRATEETIAIYATPDGCDSAGISRLPGLAAIDDLGRRSRSGRRGAIAWPEPILRNHLPDAGEGLHDGGMVARAREVQRLAKARNGKSIDRAGRRCQGGIELVAADVGI